jgi:hypothetical protein
MAIAIAAAGPSQYEFAFLLGMHRGILRAMKLGHVQRFVAAATTFAVFTAAPLTADAAPPKDKKEKEAAAEPAAESEPEPAAEPEPEPEPELEESEPELEEPEPEAAAASGGMKNRVGIGGTRSLSGVNAISLRYYPINKLDIGALLGFATFSHQEADDNGDFTQKRTVGLLGAGLHLIYWPVQGSRDQYISADFGFGARGVVYVGFGAEDDENPETREQPLEIAIEVPITTHVFIGDSVAITPEFGFVARIIPGHREPDEQDNADTNPGSGVGERLGTTNGPGLGFELGEHGGVFFGLSITYFFGGKGKGKGKRKKA